jgi:hypothetical protein
MIGITPSKKDTDNATLEKGLWKAGLNCEERSPHDEFPMTNGKPIRNSTIEARTSNFPRFAIRNSPSRLRHVRQSHCVIRHCPASHDALASEQELRRHLIESRVVDMMVAVGLNLFYTVTLPCTLWFLDKGKVGTRSTASQTKSKDGKNGTEWNPSLPDRADTVLFIDARHFYRQVDRVHREWTPAQIGFLANLVRPYRGKALDYTLGGDEARAKLEEIFACSGGVSPPSAKKAKDSAVADCRYKEVPGLCRAATLKEIEAQGWSLNPGRYVGVAAGEAVSDEDFKEQLETLNEELATLGWMMESLWDSEMYARQARDPEQTIADNVAGILSAYDELMENSQRRIRLLEAMARALYREWFVLFRFPGHAKHPRVASPLGDIPQGWEVKRVPDCVVISPRVVVPRDGEKPFVPMGCLSNDSMLITDIESRAGNSGAKFQNGDTLFARITPCLENGKTGFVQFLPDAQAVGFGSTEFIVLRSRTLTPEFVYLLARSDEFRGVAIKSMSGATGRQRVQEQCFDDFQIAQPPRALLDQFSAIVAPGFRLIYKLHLQIQNLRRTRDLLLPRLLSGQRRTRNREELNEKRKHLSRAAPTARHREANRWLPPHES